MLQRGSSRNVISARQRLPARSHTSVCLTGSLDARAAPLAGRTSETGRARVVVLLSTFLPHLGGGGLTAGGSRGRGRRALLNGSRCSPLLAKCMCGGAPRPWRPTPRARSRRRPRELRRTSTTTACAIMVMGAAGFICFAKRRSEAADARLASARAGAKSAPSSGCARGQRGPTRRWGAAQGRQDRGRSGGRACAPATHRDDLTGASPRRNTSTGISRRRPELVGTTRLPRVDVPEASA